MFASSGQSIGVSGSVSVLPLNIQGWSPLGWTGLITLLSKGLSSTTVCKHQFFDAQPSLQSNFHICTWLLENYSFDYTEINIYIYMYIYKTEVIIYGASLVAQMVKHLPTMRETQVRSLSREYPWRRKWQPTPVFLPGKSHGLRILVGYSPWGCKESDTTKQLHLSLIYIYIVSIHTHTHTHTHTHIWTYRYMDISLDIDR